MYVAMMMGLCWRSNFFFIMTTSSGFGPSNRKEGRQMLGASGRPYSQQYLNTMGHGRPKHWPLVIYF
jgi:hypothetical protein